MQNPRQLLSEYSRLVVAAGVDSQAAREFLFNHRQNQTFVQLARMTNYLLIQLNGGAGRLQGTPGPDRVPDTIPTREVPNT